MESISDKLKAWPEPPPYTFNSIDIMETIYGERRPPRTDAEHKRVEKEVERRRYIHWKEIERRSAVVRLLKDSDATMTLKEAEQIIARQLKDENSPLYKIFLQKLEKLKRG